MRAVARGDKEFPVFQTQGYDVFETSAKENSPLEKLEGPSILDMCAVCHSAPGINSLQSRRRLLKPNRPQLALDLGRNPDDAQYGPLWWEAGTTLGWKANRYDWGVLNGYWQASGGDALAGVASATALGQMSLFLFSDTMPRACSAFHLADGQGTRGVRSWHRRDAKCGSQRSCSAE